MQREPVKSSSIASVGYERSTHRMEVQFTDGRIYRYQEVPYGIFEGFLEAYSKGRYYNEKVRDQYLGKQIFPNRSK
jgi:KTSC domain